MAPCNDRSHQCVCWIVDCLSDCTETGTDSGNIRGSRQQTWMEHNCWSEQWFIQQIHGTEPLIQYIPPNKLRHQWPKIIYLLYCWCVQTATSGPFKVLGDQLRRNPDLYITDPFKVLINVVGPRAQERLRLGNNSDPFKKYWNDSWNCYVLNRHQPVSIASFYISSDLKKSGQCRTTRSIKPLLYMTALCYGFPKDSEIKELANQR